MQILKRGEIMKENNLPKILDIGGIEYIQKAEYDKAKKDINNIKQLVSSSIAGLNDFLVAQNPKQIKKERRVFFNIRVIHTSQIYPLFISFNDFLYK